MDNVSLDPDGQFFAEAYEFLAKYNWIYRSSNTEYLTRGVLAQIPNEWTDYFAQLSNDDLNALPDGLLHHENAQLSTSNPAIAPESLRTFLQQLEHLKQQMIYTSYTPPPQNHHKVSNCKGISAKKFHEIQRFTTEIDTILRATQTSPRDFILIDLGSGLGYLSQLLNSLHGYRVLGVEANAEHVLAARQRQQTYYPQSLDSVVYTQHFVLDVERSAQHILAECAKWFDIGPANTSVRYAIIGLHACAMLSVTAAKLFLHMDGAVVLSIMPCCYHKMFDAGNSDRIERAGIPLSRSMVMGVRPQQRWQDDVVNIPFLRLACQQTAARWRRESAAEHRAHGAAMWERAVLQAVLADGECIVSTKRIADVNLHSDVVNRWPILRKYSLMDANRKEIAAWSESYCELADSIRKSHPNGASISEFLTGLQATVQNQSAVAVRVCCAVRSGMLLERETRRIRRECVVAENLLRPVVAAEFPVGRAKIMQIKIYVDFSVG